MKIAFRAPPAVFGPDAARDAFLFARQRPTRQVTDMKSDILRERQASQREGRTVLLVEDEPMVRSVAERALTRHGYTVITADNGEDALEIIAKNEPIDLLISDVVMPGMDGPTMVREARLSRPELKILFISGYAEEQLRKSIDIENVNFLPKPFSVTELAEAARRAVVPK